MTDKLHPLSNKKLIVFCFISLFTLVSATIVAQVVPGDMSKVAGTGVAGYNADGIKATTAQLNHPAGVAVDDSGNIYIADQDNNMIRKVYKTTGNIATIAGTRKKEPSDEDGPDNITRIDHPLCVRVDSLGNVYFSDPGHAVIRKISPKGVITIIAGVADNPGYSGDSTRAVAAMLNYPCGICLDKDLNLYIADQKNNVIRKVNAKTGIITTVAGNKKAKKTGNGGQATAARLNNPTGVAVDRSGNIYIADLENHVVRVVNNQGIISIFAGTGVLDEKGLSGPAKTTNLGQPWGITTDAGGNVYIADAGTGLIRKVLISDMLMSIIGSNLTGPSDIAVSKTGDIYIAEQGDESTTKGGNTIRKIAAATK